MEAGDHLVSPRIGYTHHGLYIGNNQVIHYSGFANGLSSGEIEITNLDDFSHGNEITVQDHMLRTYDHDESVNRAHSRIGEDWYNVLINNCEHFVTWCITGFHSSSQVNKMIAVIALQYGRSMAVSTTERVIVRSVTNVAIGSTVKYATTKSAGTAAGVVAATAFSTGAGVTIGIASGIAAGAVGVAAAPVAVGVGVAYGIKKVWDFFTD